MQNIYPKLKEFCRTKYGFEFQVQNLFIYLFILISRL